MFRTAVKWLRYCRKCVKAKTTINHNYLSEEGLTFHLTLAEILSRIFGFTLSYLSVLSPVRLDRSFVTKFKQTWYKATVDDRNFTFNLVCLFDFFEFPWAALFFEH